MWYIVFLFIIGLNVLFNYYLNKKSGYPPFLFSLLWFGVIFCHFICVTFDLVTIFVLSFKALFIYTLGVVMFTFGGLAVKLKSNNDVFIKPEDIDFRIKNKFDVVLIIISLIFLPFFLISSYKLAVEYMIFDSLFAGLRNSFVQEQDIGFSKYGIIISFVSFFVQGYQYFSLRNNKLKFILSAIVLLLFCVFSTGRTFFIFYISLIYGLLIVFQKFKKKYIYYGISGILVLFSTIGILLNKGGSTENNLQENISGIVESFVIYFIGSLSAFDAFLHSHYVNTVGENSFRFVFSFLYKFGFIESKPGDLVDQYVSIPFDTNVYTIYKIYFQDFGFIYMIFLLFIFGLVHTYFYLKAIRERKFAPSIIYAIMLYPLFMSFFQEQYFSLLPTWIYIFMIVLFGKYYIKVGILNKEKS
ncbi:O-antigen polymerase [Flavobacterium cellulosilyticum]|uniref:Oligosaccharide repeat unit polymerase n=1 Tax=Flavobacterium cellulosilyticum TaxID=2541731 RepID=A0A4R5CE93_9FLAO|nr:O-antigen polymerase [Flavobacterium cellulosilyticum]TDD98378.1 oligosaccharide repeat unit polymerase [Flavobacterium cellulosilyticum]